ncbi:MAG: AMP-binding protein [Jiangellaceae bacterium]|nr:AMP-binding protein [Jiangellaceae bacterium]
MSPRRAVRVGRVISRFGLTLASAAEMSAIRFPTRAGIVDDGGSLTYAELRDVSVAVATVLHEEHGVREGARLGVLCRNHRDFVIASVAGSRLGADLVLLSTDLGVVSLGQVLHRERVDVVVLDEEFIDLRDRAGTGGPWVTGPELRTLAAGKTASTLSPPGSRGRLVVLTSGTTGVPKGAPRGAGELRMGLPVTSLLAALRLRSGQPMVIQPPLFHGFGLGFLAAALTLGCPAILARRLDGQHALELVDRHRATVLACVPVLLHRIMAVPPELRTRYEISSLRAVVSGGAPLRPALAHAVMAEYGDVLFDLYGTTEAGWATLATPDDLRAAPGTVGRPAHGIRIAVLDSAGDPLPPDVPGEIYIGSRLSFRGYTGGGSKRVVRGLMSTGDVGWLDTQGRLFVAGRADEMVVSGGENVYPQEVEDALAEHPAVADVAVVGVPDPEFGQRLAARVVRKDQVTADELRAHVAGVLGRHKVPRDVEFVDALPRTSTGKARRPTAAVRSAGSGPA